MLCFNRIFFTLMAICCLSPAWGEMRIWTDIYGNARRAELIHAFGPVAYFMDSQKGFVSFRTEELVEDDRAVVEAFKQSQTNHPWETSDTLMASLLRDRLMCFKDGSFVEYKFGPGVEPDFYLLCFVDSKSEEGRNFIPKLIKAYAELKETGLGNFEVIHVGMDRKEAAMKDYIREMEIPWPAVNWDSRKKIRAIDSSRKKKGLTLVLADQEGNVIQRAVTRKGGDSPISILVALNNHLTWSNPDNFLVKKVSHAKFLKEYLEETRPDSPPLPHDCDLDGIDFSALPGQSFTIRLQVTEKGLVENAEIISDISEEMESVILKVSSSWLFIPCIQEGNYARSLITFPVSEPSS